MYFKMLELTFENKITHIKVTIYNGSIFTIKYPENKLLDIDIFNIIESKSIFELYDNIRTIIDSYNINTEEMIFVKEFIKWIIYSLNLHYIELN